MTEPVLSLRGISKRYGVLQVLKNVDLDVYPGEVVALLGENGAGKSTKWCRYSSPLLPPPRGEGRGGGGTAQHHPTPPHTKQSPKPPGHGKSVTTPPRARPTIAPTTSGTIAIASRP